MMTQEEETIPTVGLSLTVNDGNKALDLYARAFGAKETYRMSCPDGGVAHAEFTIGNTLMYLSEESEEWHAYAMPEGARASCLFGIHTENCDADFKKAVEAGCEPLNEPTDYFWGMRSGMVLDPFGYRWSFGQVIEEVSPEEMAKRAEEAFGKACES